MTSKPLRVALYARYSSDNQRDASIEDQLRQCRERAAREGWTIVESYSDRAISGASLIRFDIQSVLADAQAGRFDILLSEALSLRIEANDLVVVCGDKTTEPCFQARGLRRCPFVVEERDSLLDLMDGDDRQK